MKYSILLLSLLLTGCATGKSLGRHKGDCTDYKGKVFHFEDNEVREYKAWEWHVKVGEGAYYLFHPSKCKLTKI